MKDVVDKCSIKGCVIDIGMVIDNDNCISKFLCFFVICEEVEFFMIKLKEFVVVVFFVDEGVSVVYKIKDLEG